jgi:ADP-ribosylglycohydrolase
MLTMKPRKTILILEDNDERIAAFEKAVAALGGDFEVKIWRDAPSMIAECEQFFATAVLISLDHDLNPQPGSTCDPGTGADVARHLADYLPVCPVIVHSSNIDRVYSMDNELRFSQWITDRVGPLGSSWIATSWVATAKRLLGTQANTWNVSLPPDHQSRVERMMLALDGLALGDALGEMLSYQAHSAPQRLKNNNLPAGPWSHTDDTEMAISIVTTLKSHGCIHQDAVAKRFARRFERDPDRGYGKMTRMQLREMMAGGNWRDLSKNAFSGNGSMGNGSAMRVAPLGAYFADDLATCAKQAAASSVVTHAHPEGIAGAIAIAIAAAMACQLRDKDNSRHADTLFDAILTHTPESQVRRGVLLARDTPRGLSADEAAKLLGKGDQITAPDTVPFCVWIAARHLNDFVDAISNAICVGGDCDTNAAIAGGIVALSAGRETIPTDWLAAREPLFV